MRIATEIAVGLIGVAFIVCALAVGQRWLDRHFLPSFFISREMHVRLETAARVVIATIGAVLALVVRPRIGRLAGHAPMTIVNAVIAAVLALAAGALALRWTHVQPAAWLFANQEPLRQRDQALGWTLVPSRVGHNLIGGRSLDYAIDPSGFRVRRLDEPVDLARPTVLFTGESVMFGEGLTWDETVPARVAALTGVQSANLAVHGYGSDQAYLRLMTELPRFRRPVAIVSLFITALFERNLEDDRPHLGPGLVPMPPERRGRLGSLVMIFAPYRTDRDVDDGVAMTRDVLRATIRAASDRQATAVIVVPQIGHESDVERSLRKRILDDAAIPYMWIPLGAEARIAGDSHPNAGAAQVIAEAITARLRQAGTGLAMNPAGSPP